MPDSILTNHTAAGDLRHAAATLRSLHRPGAPLVLVNVWDAASAQHVARAGAAAIGTSSAAIAASLGVPDGPGTDVDAMFAAIGRIAGAVGLPVTADLLDGYGLSPDELVDRLLDAGAVGCNLEDSNHARPGALLGIDEVTKRIAGVRDAAAARGVDVVVNARIDAYLLHGPGATNEVIVRAREALAAGADCVYPVRLVDPAVARELVTALDAPVNANLPPGSGPEAMAAAGVARLSIGPSAFHRALGALDEVAAALLGPSPTER
jgi:2-methylisocitrate lyase-like PEP mutase family enzyme